MEIASFIVALVALIGSALGYLLHDRKLKKQEEKLNMLQVEELEDSAKAKRQAKVIMQTYYQEKGRGILQIKNIGQAPAHNIRWHFQSHILENIPTDGDYELLQPEQEIGLRYIYMGQNEDTVKVNISWDDDISKENHIEILLFAMNKPCS